MANAKDTLRSVLVVIATAVTIALNVLASMGKLNGVLTNEVSDKYPTVITPAGFAFTIWALIYTGLAVFSIYQLLPSKAEKYRGVRTLYIVSCVLNCGWILAWHNYAVGIAAVLIVILAAVLVMIARSFAGDAGSLAEAVLTKAIFGIYAGWVSAAALVNLIVFAKFEGIEMSSLMWNLIGMLCLAIAAAFAVMARLKLRNYFFPLSIAWAATGIAVKQTGNTAIIVTSAFCVIVSLVASVSFVLEGETFPRNTDSNAN